MNTPVRLVIACVLALAASASVSFADTYFNNGVLGASAGSPTAHESGQSSSGTGMQYYNLYSISVTTSGSYTFELASPNTAGATSNALDTYLAIFTGTFTPPTLGAAGSRNDDFTGTLTVLPGPYAGTVSATSTGFQGAQPGSRLTGIALTAGTTYYIYVSSFRDTSFVSTSSSAQASGAYYLGVSGTGSIAVTPVVQTVPEPSTLSILGLGSLGAVALSFWRRRRSA